MVMGPAALSVTSPGAAVGAMVASVGGVGAERVALGAAAGRVLAEDVRSDRLSPAVDVSSMDGFAVRVAEILRAAGGGADGARGGAVRVAGEVRIGSGPARLPEGACLRIVTGGAVPAGADAVVKVEDVTEGEAGIVVSVAVAGRLVIGENVRRAGENLGAGELVVKKGTVVTAAVAGTLGGFGVVSPSVYRRLRVGVVTTGDEVVSPEETPTAWQVRDSNGPALAALLGRTAWVEELRLERARDEPGALLAAARRGLEGTDALLMTGGVSMGHRDFVAGVLGACGVRTLFHGVPQRPGKPVLGGVTGDGRPVFGLPGNPVSVLVTARRMAVAVLEHRARASPGRAPAAVTVRAPDDRRLNMWWHRLVAIGDDGRAALIGGKSSGDIVAAARSDGFVEVPPGGVGEGPWPYYPWTV